MKHVINIMNFFRLACKETVTPKNLPITTGLAGVFIGGFTNWPVIRSLAEQAGYSDEFVNEYFLGKSIKTGLITVSGAITIAAFRSWCASRQDRNPPSP